MEINLPGVDIPHAELVAPLVLLATNLIISTLKALGLKLTNPNDWLKINAAVSALVGSGVAALAEGEPLPRVLLWAIVTGAAALSSVAIHHVGATARAGRAALKTYANGGKPKGKR